MLLLFREVNSTITLSLCKTSQLAQRRCHNVVTTSWLALSQRCGTVENESCGNVGLQSLWQRRFPTFSRRCHVLFTSYSSLLQKFSGQLAFSKRNSVFKTLRWNSTVHKCLQYSYSEKFEQIPKQTYVMEVIYSKVDDRQLLNKINV